MSKQAASKQTLITLLLVLLVAGLLLLAYYGYRGLEWAEEEVDLGWSERAWHNPFLAAEYFMRAAGYDSETIRSYYPIDRLGEVDSVVGDTDTLVLVDGFNSFTPAQIEKLIAWIDNGGTLIASSENRFRSSKDQQDPLLLHYGISVDHAAKQDSEADDKRSESRSADRKAKSPRRKNDVKANADKNDHEEDGAESDMQPWNSIIVEEDDKHKVIATPGWGPTLLIDNDAEDAVYRSSKRGIELVSISIDKNRVAVTSGNNLWSNGRINEHDNAYLLWLLSAETGKIWFIINQKAPSLIEWLWRLSSLGVLGLLLWILLWVWRSCRRFGPLLFQNSRSRRRLLEHLESTTRLLWARRQGDYMVEELRDDTIRKILAKYPHVRSMARDEQLTELVRLTELPVKTLRYLYESVSGINERLFTEHIKQLQTIRERL